MNRCFLTIVFVLLAGCAAGPGGIQGVFRNTGDYEVTVTDKTDAFTIEKLVPELGSYFVEFGVDSCLTAEVREGSRSFSVFTATFLTAKGATGAYEYSRPREGEPLEIGDRGIRSADGIDFVRGNHLVRVRPAAGADMEGVEKLARTFARRIPGGPFPPAVFSPLPKEGLVPNSELFFMGPRVFGARFSPELAEALSIGTSIDGVTARYTLQSGEEISIVKVRFSGRTQTVQAIHDFVQSLEGVPMVRPSDNRNYYTIFNPDNTEMYLAEYSDWLLFIPDAPRGGKAQWLFEFALRSI